jgi:hypothetical protein
LTLSLNDQPLDGAWVLDAGWQVVEVTLPESVLRQGLNTLTLNFDHAVAPSSVLPDNTDDRPLSAAVDWVEINGR